MKFVTQNDWQEVTRLAVDPPGQKVTFYFRAESVARIYVTEGDDTDSVLAAVGQGDLEVQLVGWGPAWLYVESDGAVWVRSDQIDQTTKAVFGTCFTEPLQRREVHPEVRRMQELMKRNELMREQQMREWREAIEARVQNASRLIDDAVAKGSELERSGSAGGAPEEGGDGRSDGESVVGEQEGADVQGAQAAASEGSE